MEKLIKPMQTILIMKIHKPQQHLKAFLPKNWVKKSWEKAKDPWCFFLGETLGKTPETLGKTPPPTWASQKKVTKTVAPWRHPGRRPPRTPRVAPATAELPWGRPAAKHGRGGGEKLEPQKKPPNSGFSKHVFYIFCVKTLVFCRLVSVGV